MLARSQRCGNGVFAAGQQELSSSWPVCLDHRSMGPCRARCIDVSCRSGGGRGGGGGGPKKAFKLREYKASDGKAHLGSALADIARRSFPGPPPDSGAPLRILPIGGLGEIGMNCMLVGCYDRYIVIDAGLMFPDFQDLGMQKILPDTSFLHQWRDKIEALVITHGHEDHIGAMPWVVPALDPSTPIFASSFVMRLIQRRLTEFSLFDESRFKVFDMNQPFQAGPFEVEPVRVTHSIPDCCGLILRSDHGTIVHTGDWKIDETPVDGLQFDRTTFDRLSKENVVLMMSDSTNVLSPGRTPSEKVVEQSLVSKVAKHAGKGRVVVTQFASNLHRLHSVKQAADASGRKICFVGMSLNHYLEAAFKDGRAPFDPQSVIQAAEIDDYDPNQVLIVTTGSQAEPRAALSLAAKEASHQLKLKPKDLVLYSAKVIPGNEKRVVRMLNSIAALGATVVQGRNDNLHVSGHAYQEELLEVLRLVKPQHFLPVHGEYSFLCEHARLAREQAGIHNCSVIKNGTMLGVQQLRNRNTVSTGSRSGASIVGEVNLINFYNDGNKGTGTAQEMAIVERSTLAFEGIVVAALDIYRDDGSPLRCRCRVTTRGMWTGNGTLLADLHTAIESIVARMAVTASLATVERQVIDTVKRACKAFNGRQPEVICIAHENDPRAAHMTQVAPSSIWAQPQRQQGSWERGGRGAQQSQWSGGAGQRQGGAARPWAAAPSGGPAVPSAAAAGSRPAASMDHAGQTAASPAADALVSRSPDAASEGESSADEAPAPAPKAVAGQVGVQEATEQPPPAPAPAPAPEAATSSTAAAAQVDEEPASASEQLPAGKKPRSARSAAAVPVGEQPATGTKEMLVRKKAQGTRTAAAKKAKAASAAEDTLPMPGPPLEVLPEGVLKTRKARNPRDKPVQENDPDYG